MQIVTRLANGQSHIVYGRLMTVCLNLHSYLASLNYPRFP